MTTLKANTMKATPGMTAARDARTEVVMPRGRIEDPVRREEADALDDRRASLKAMEAEFARAAIERVQAFTALARGEVREKATIRALAPTKALAEMHFGAGRRKGWITARQLAGAAQYRHLSDCAKVGRAAIDPAAIRVDGGGGGSIEAALAHAADAERLRKAARSAIARSDHFGLGGRLVDWVVLNEGALDDYGVGSACPFEKEEYQRGARRLAFLAALNRLADHFGL